MRGRSIARGVSAAAAPSSTSRSRVRHVGTGLCTTLRLAPAPTRTSSPRRCDCWSSHELHANRKHGPGRGLLARARGRTRRTAGRESSGRASGRSAPARFVGDEAFVGSRLATVLPPLATKQWATSPRRRRRHRMSVPWRDRRFGWVALVIRTSALGSLFSSSR